MTWLDCTIMTESQTSCQPLGWKSPNPLHSPKATQLAPHSPAPIPSRLVERSPPALPRSASTPLLTSTPWSTTKPTPATPCLGLQAQYFEIPWEGRFLLPLWHFRGPGLQPHTQDCGYQLEMLHRWREHQSHMVLESPRPATQHARLQVQIFKLSFHPQGPSSTTRTPLPQE